MAARRKRYERPEVKKVRLAVEEALLAGCKVKGVTCLDNPAQNDLVPGLCLEDGS